MPDEEKPKGGLRAPIELWSAMFRQLTPRNVARVLPAWLGCVVGLVIAATGDSRGSMPQTVIGFVILVPCMIVFFTQVCRIFLPLLRR